MEWYYAVGTDRFGPIDETTFQSLLENGTIGPSTLVWNADLPNWTLWGALSGASSRPSPPPLDPTVPVATCVECGHTFQEDDGIRIEDRFVCAGCKPTFFMRVHQGQPAISNLVYAGFWRRLVAKIIDVIIVQLPFQVLILFLQDVVGLNNPDTEFTPLLIVFFFAAWLVPLAANFTYNAYFLSTSGATLGKKVVRIRVIRPDGETLTFARGIGRTAAEIISGIICYIGYIMCVFDERKRTLHDHMADTIVVRDSPVR